MLEILFIFEHQPVLLCSTSTTLFISDEMHKKIPSGQPAVAQLETSFTRSIYFQKGLRRYLDKKSKETGHSLNKLVNDLIRRDLADNGG